MVHDYIHGVRLQEYEGDIAGREIGEMHVRTLVCCICLIAS